MTVLETDLLARPVRVPLYPYITLEKLRASLGEHIIAPTAAKVHESHVQRGQPFMM